MTLLSLILALGLEQLRPLGNRNRVWLLFVRYANYLERNLNAGSNRHGVFAWILAIVPAMVLSVAIHYGLKVISPVLALVWDVLVLYLTMGFRHFSSAFSEVSQALAEGRDLDARQALSQWTGQPCAELSTNEVARLSIEHGVMDSYRFVFGTMFWFVLLPGRCRRTGLASLPIRQLPGWTGCLCAWRRQVLPSWATLKMRCIAGVPRREPGVITLMEFCWRLQPVHWGFAWGTRSSRITPSSSGLSWGWAKKPIRIICEALSG